MTIEDLNKDLDRTNQIGTNYYYQGYWLLWIDILKWRRILGYEEE